MRLFRPAAEAPDWRNLGKTGLQTVCFWSVLLWIVPVAIQRFETRMGAPTYDLVPAVGIALLVVSSLGGL